MHMQSRMYEWILANYFNIGIRNAVQYGINLNHAIKSINAMVSVKMLVKELTSKGTVKITLNNLQ